MSKKRANEEDRRWWSQSWVWVDTRLSQEEQVEALTWARENDTFGRLEQLLEAGYAVDLGYDHKSRCPLVVLKYPYTDSVEGGHRMSTRAATLSDALDMALYKYTEKLGGKLAGHAADAEDLYG